MTKTGDFTDQSTFEIDFKPLTYHLDKTPDKLPELSNYFQTEKANISLAILLVICYQIGLPELAVLYLEAFHVIIFSVYSKKNP